MFKSKDFPVKKSEQNNSPISAERLHSVIAHCALSSLGEEKHVNMNANVRLKPDKEKTCQ